MQRRSELFRGHLFGDASKAAIWLAPGIKTWVMVLRAVALVVLVAGAAVAVWNAWVVLRSGRRRLAKLWSVVLAVSCLTMLWVGLVFRMAGLGGDF